MSVARQKDDDDEQSLSTLDNSFSLSQLPSPSSVRCNSIPVAAETTLSFLNHALHNEMVFALAWNNIVSNESQYTPQF
jgi:hypothetical protein